MDQKVKERIKKITPILIFNILLPTIDIITDLLIIIRLFEGSYKCNQDDSTASLFEYEQCKAYGPPQLLFLPQQHLQDQGHPSIL